MCIIVVKNKDIDLPSKEILKTCFENNSDGCGFSFYNEKENNIVTIKGFMNFNEFYKKLMKINSIVNLKKSSMIFHFRISTSGLVDSGNCHPLPITQNDEYLRTLKFESSIAFCHNGIISAYNRKHDKLNDTQLFSKKVLFPLYKLNKEFYKDNDILEFLRDFTSSKLAIITNENEIYKVGDFIEKDGLYFSNSTYEKRTYYSSGYNYSKYWDDWGDWYYNKGYSYNTKKIETKKETTEKRKEKKYYSFMIYDNIKLLQSTFNDLMQDATELKTNYKVKKENGDFFKIDKNGKYIADHLKNIYVIDKNNNMIKKQFKAIDILKNNQSIYELETSN